MVKTDYGVIRGESKFLRCFSRDPVTKEGFKEFTDEAGAMVKKRDKLEWESFDTFVEDVKRLAGGGRCLTPETLPTTAPVTTEDTETNASTCWQLRSRPRLFPR